MPSWLSPPAVAKLLGIEPQKVRAWLDRGELVGVNIANHVGGRPRWRISQQALDDFLARRSSAPAPKTPRRRKAKDVSEFV